MEIDIIKMSATKKNKIDSLNLRSEEVQEIMNRMPHWTIRYGNSLMLSLVLIILFLSWLIKYPEIINAQAIVTTLPPPQKLIAKSNGKIEHLLIENGDTVLPGKAIAIMENTADYSDIFFLESIIDTLKINYSDFSFPMDKLPALNLGDLEDDFALFQNNYYQYWINKQLNPFSKTKVTNQKTQNEIISRLQVLEYQKEINEKELHFKNIELLRYKTLFQKGVVSAQEYESKQIEQLQAERNLKNINVSISQMKENLVAASQTISETVFNQTSEEIRLLNVVLQSFSQLVKSINDWKIQNAFVTDIRGNVSYINAWTNGQNIQAGELLFTVIPVGKITFIAKLKTPSQNFGKIKIGQKVNVNLHNFPSEEYGIIEGKVSQIASLPDKDGFYAVDVRLTDSLVTTFNKPLSFSYEMLANAEIVTEDLRLIERFFNQLRKVLSRN